MFLPIFKQNYWSCSINKNLAEQKFVKVIKGLFENYGIANIGIKPTFNTTTPLLEVNIFDFDKDIYDKTLDVELLVFMRPERKFNSIDDLKWHINFDIRSAKYAVKNLDRWYRGV